MLFFFSVGCDGVKHIIQIEEPLDHTQGDDGGKLKYKIIFGDRESKGMTNHPYDIQMMSMFIFITLYLIMDIIF